eukprot:10776101-Lingulodinium_polyedra.AAC.1
MMPPFAAAFLHPQQLFTIVTAVFDTRRHALPCIAISRCSPARFAVRPMVQCVVWAGARPDFAVV